MTSMSGGRLVVLDRQGRPVKYCPLAEGSVTIGRDVGCDIRVLQSAVNEIHATLAVIDNQAIVNNVEDSKPLVNGQPVREAILCHNDIITVGDRSLRWEYNNPNIKRVHRVVGYTAGRGRRKVRTVTMSPQPSLRDRAIRLALEIKHRASMPGSTGGKQVAIVQPQRRDTSEQVDKTTTPRPNTTNTRPRNTNNQMDDTSINESETDRSKRKSVKISHKTASPNLQTTKATLWIESRKTSPRRSTKVNRSVNGNSSVDSVRGHKSTATVVEGHESTATTVQDHQSLTITGESRQRFSCSIRRRKVLESGDDSRSKSANSVQLRTSPRKSGRVLTPAQMRIATVRKMYSSVKKATPLRMSVLKKAQSAQKARVTKIQDPLKIDHTKQAALLLMTGHTPKSKISPLAKRPSYIVKRPSPVAKTSRGGRKSSGRRSKENNTPTSIGLTPKRTSTYDSGSRKTNTENNTVTILEITDSEAQNSTQKTSRRSGQKSLVKSPLLPSPKKSALKDPKRNSRKTESIKFDLSNLENQDTLDVLMVADTTNRTYDGDRSSETDMTLHYSDGTSSPSPRRPINSRTSKILEKTLGTTLTLSTPISSAEQARTLTPESPGSRKSLRGSLILQKALDASNNECSESTYSRRTSKTLSETNQSNASSLASAYKTRTLSPRSTRNNIESYSIVDLVSIDSNDTAKSASLYDSVGSSNSTEFGTPQNSTGRKTRSTIDSNFLGSSTPYVGKPTRASSRGLSQSYRSANRSQSTPDVSQASKSYIQNTRTTISTRRSKSLTTPENTQNHITVNSTRISRRSRSRSRLNDSDLLLLDGEESDASPKTSRRVRNASQNLTNTLTESSIVQRNEGTITPEDRYSPQDIGTPVLSIQSLLNSSQNSLTSHSSHKNGRRSYKRKTIGVLSENRKRQSDFKSRSLNISARKTALRLSTESSDDSVRTDEGAPLPDSEDVVTPKSAVKLIPEAVKNKHSTAKKPLSKRSIIDDLNQSDIVKQLFNSPVKRKLSQSMSEFSRKRLFDEDDDVIFAKRPTRNTIALIGRTPDTSVMDHTEAFTPERFVSPISTPSNSPNLSGIKRLFRKNTPNNDLRDVRGVKALLRSPRTRGSTGNDLKNLSGVKSVFARSPLNRLSDVGVKNVFARSPENDLRKVSGVKSLFQRQNSPKNDLTDVRGVKRMFTRNSPANDLRNVSGLRQIQRKSPKNDLRDVRGVRKMFKQDRQRTTFNVSGVEELFNTSNQSHRDTDSIFDQLLGKPSMRAVYSNTFSTRVKPKSRSRRRTSLHVPIDQITDNVEEWLQKELQKRLNKDTSKTSNNLTRELNRIATNTIQGSTPIRISRVRESTLTKIKMGEQERKKSASEIYSARKLPIKKRSLVEKSLEISNKARLPIKKRLIVHSTPVKGWNSVMMNASELGRVSPIATDEKTREVQPSTSASARLSKDQKAPKSNKPTRKSKNDKTVVEETVPLKPSPKKTRATTKSSPKITNTRSRRNAKMTNSDNTIKRQSTLVITKKTPVKSPQSTQVTPGIRTRRQKQEVKLVTPKVTRAKVLKGTVVVSKPSPVLKPKVANTQQNISNVKATRGRKAIVNESHKRTVKTARSNKTNAESSSEKEISTPAPAKRGRKTITEQIKEVETKGRARVVIEQRGSSKVTRQAKTKVNTPVKSPKNQSVAPRTRRGKVVESEIQVLEQRGSKRQAVEISEVSQRRGRKQQSKTTESNTPQQPETKVPPRLRKRQSKELASATVSKTRTRSNKELIKPDNTQVEDNSKPKRPNRLQKAASDELKTDLVTERKTRTRRNKDTSLISKDNESNTKVTSRLQNTASVELAGAAKGRKRKIAIEDEVPPKVSRGRNKTVEPAVIVTKDGRQKRNAVKDKVEVDNDKAVDKSAGVAGRGRGRRAAAVTATKSIQETNKRKRRTNAETSTAQDTTKEPTAKRTRRAAELTVAKTPLKSRTQRVVNNNKQTQDTTKEPTAKRSRRAAEVPVVKTPLKSRAQRSKNIQQTQVTNKSASRTRRR